MSHPVETRERPSPFFGRIAVNLARPLLRYTPLPLQRIGMESILNDLFARPLQEGRLDFLENRSVMIDISDLDYRWVISLYRGRILLLDSSQGAEVTIRGDSRQFLALGLRTEDPDMFFFQRRLAVRGDTELGLGMKNFLDSIDADDLPAIIGLIPGGLKKRFLA